MKSDEKSWILSRRNAGLTEADEEGYAGVVQVDRRDGEQEQRDVHSRRCQDPRDRIGIAGQPAECRSKVLNARPHRNRADEPACMAVYIGDIAG